MTMRNDDVYLDNNATTPLDPRVLEAMLPWLTARHGNPSSIHRHGRATREAIEQARGQVAGLLGCRAPEVVFAGSGTEANNAVLMTMAANPGGGASAGHLVISALEHPSVSVAAEALARRHGTELTRVAPGPQGVVAAAEVIAALRDDTRLVCLMLANNEVGTVQPVAEVAAACRERGIPVLSDAVQAAGKMAVRVEELGVDYLTIGGHKFHGPLGAAALYIRGGPIHSERSVPFTPLLLGGSQEKRRRASTENVPAIVGLGEACRLAHEELAERARSLAELRDAFEAGLREIPDVVIHCRDAPRLPHTSHVAFLGVEAESLLIRLDMAGFAVSTGSACSSGVVEPSKTLTAMGIGRQEALASLRISFGMLNRREEVEPFLRALAENLGALRRLAPMEPFPMEKAS